MLQKCNQQPGYVIIISIVIIGAIATSVAIAMLSNGTDATKNSLTNIRLIQARSLADACNEEALQKIRETSYTGSFNLSFTSGTCSSTVTSIASPNFTINTTGSSTSAIKKIRATINQLSPKINISSWQELSDF